MLLNLLSWGEVKASETVCDLCNKSFRALPNALDGTVRIRKICFLHRPACQFLQVQKPRWGKSTQGVWNATHWVQNQARSSSLKSFPDRTLVAFHCFFNWNWVEFWGAFLQIVHKANRVAYQIGWSKQLVNLCHALLAVMKTHQIVYRSHRLIQVSCFYFGEHNLSFCYLCKSWKDV